MYFIQSVSSISIGVNMTGPKKIVWKIKLFYDNKTDKISLEANLADSIKVKDRIRKNIRHNNWCIVFAIYK